MDFSVIFRAKHVAMVPDSISFSNFNSTDFSYFFKLSKSMTREFARAAETQRRGKSSARRERSSTPGSI